MTDWKRLEAKSTGRDIGNFMMRNHGGRMKESIHSSRKEKFYDLY